MIGLMARHEARSGTAREARVPCQPDILRAVPSQAGLMAKYSGKLLKGWRFATNLTQIQMYTTEEGDLPQ